MEPLRPADSGRTSKRRSKRVSADGTHPGGFAQRLHGSADHPVIHDTMSLEAPRPEEIDADIEALLDDVHTKGQILLNSRTYSAAQEYRQTIQSFFRRVIPNAVSIDTHESKHDIMHRKRYTLISEVDRKVDRLISGVVQAQAEQIEIISRLKEIEGLLVDLLQ